MAEETKFGTLLTGLDVLGKGLQTYATVESYKSLANTAEKNAELLNLSGQAAVNDAEFEVNRIERAGSKVIGKQMSDYAKVGVTFEGSPAQAFLESASAIRRDVVMTRMNAQSLKAEAAMQALNQKVKASQARSRAKQERIKGILDIGTTLLTGFGG